MILNKIAVIGAGNIGIGVAADLILHGIHTVLVDISESRLNKAKDEIKKNIRYTHLFNKSKMQPEVDNVDEKICLSTEIKSVGDCEFIIENVTEDWDVKQKVYTQLNSVTGTEVCYGVNTSCISITRIGSITEKPDKVVGIHFMNPVYLKSTVEVIKGVHTSDDTLNIVGQLFKQLDKTSIVVNDMPGFVSNRISHLFMNEAAFVLQDQVAAARDIDEIFKKCFGHAMGPLETADLIGLDTVVNSLEVLYDSYKDPKFRCCPLLKKLVHAGYLGRKTGKGFYEYPDV